MLVSDRTIRTRLGVRTGPLKVLIVTNDWIYGGRDRVVTSLCEEFHESLGWDVALVVARRRNADGTALLERFPEPRGTPVRFLEADRLRGIVFPLARVLRDLGPDVVFWHADAYAFPYYWLASVLAGCTRRVVAVHHSIMLVPGTSAGSRLREWLRGTIVRMVSVNVAVSQGTASTVEKRSRLKPGSVQVVHNAIDLADVREGASASEPEELRCRHPVVLAVARLSPEKNWETLVGAFAIVSAAMPVSLCIVGEGAQREQIVRLAQDAGVAERVIMAGNQPNPYRYMAHADAFALSSHHEGFGMVLLEAMACGVPVVSSDCESGPRELITHGKNGLLVAPEDPGALAEGILAVLTDAKLAQSLREGGLERARDFDRSITVEAYRQIAENVSARSATQ